MNNQGSCSIKTADTSCEKKKCCGTLIKGALIGGIVMFIYIWGSWMMVPWHKNTMMSFKNEAAVASALSANAEKSGIYVLSQQKESKAANAAMVPSKPFAFVSVFTKGADIKDMTRQLAYTFLLSVFSALLLTAMLKRGACCGGCPVGFSMTVGLLVACANHLPDLIWYHFPLPYTLVGMADDIISFTLAGAVISKCLFSNSSCATTGKTGCA